MEPAPVLPNLIIGPIVILAGIAIVRFRTSLYRRTVRDQERMFGKRVNAFVSRFQSAFWVGVMGVWGILLGVMMVGFGVSRLL